ncbi:4a-hydroxytetrahydrobiopterin dehydratase [Friedmanniella endophytica]|uniref:Putative pterin-4-alpha-carbinolamine dehydratase n=1 Tax=Microlunatus kandeliicorticis TaxID=1759536 RepID=A0A7W3P629_9ACTN|nr:VOC family protein [Microlunatus kandeliicorticis]MBA8794518.1 4a-hydroxytetrahydrobiopterin dehydratase [Microlunatus kandeliicorticis]
MDTLSNTEVAAAGLADWRKLGQALHARFRIPDLDTGARFAVVVAEAVGDHHPPEIRLGAGFADLAVATREGGIWVTAADLDLARRISEIAAGLGLVPAPGEVAQVEYGLDTDDWERIGPFWAALMTGDASATIGNNVLDPTNRVANVWFQGTEPHETPRQRWHPDLWVAPETAQSRIAAALAAGGTVVDDSGAPSYTVLADPDGNKVCVCTSLDR